MKLKFRHMLVRNMEQTITPSTWWSYGFPYEGEPSNSQEEVEKKLFFVRWLGETGEVEVEEYDQLLVP